MSKHQRYPILRYVQPGSASRLLRCTIHSGRTMVVQKVRQLIKTINILEGLGTFAIINCNMLPRCRTLLKLKLTQPAKMLKPDMFLGVYSHRAELQIVFSVRIKGELSNRPTEVTGLTQFALFGYPKCVLLIPYFQNPSVSCSFSLSV